MGIIRPATPGFLVTLTATALLAVVSFCVPYFKSVYFLKASISISGTPGSITFGTLGYCLELPSGSACSSPKIGYQLDINSLVANNLPIQIPQVLVKWLTYCLVLHIVAFGLAGLSTFFGLLAHVRELSMTCCSTCISGLAAAVTFLAFIFDISIFFAAKARISSVGTAEIGTATWLTLAAWILLFFSATFFSLGRCCLSRRPGKSWLGHSREAERAEQMRLDAVKAEADRKAHQNKSEVGLPSFPEYQPLTGYIDGNKVYTDQSHQDNPAYGGRPVSTGGISGGGYVRAPAGSRAVDQYYTPSRTGTPSTPTLHNVQPSGYVDDAYTQSVHNPNPVPCSPRRQSSGYTPSQYSASVYTTQTQPMSPPPSVSVANNPYLAAPQTHYGHTGGSSYYPPTTYGHGQQPTNYSSYEPDYYQQTQYNPPVPKPSEYNATNYYTAAPTSQPLQPVPERSYTLGGDSYGADPYGAEAYGVPPAAVPAAADSYNNAYYPLTTATAISESVNQNTGHLPQQHADAPQSQNALPVRNDDAPPIYEPASPVDNAWNNHSH